MTASLSCIPTHSKCSARSFQTILLSKNANFESRDHCLILEFLQGKVEEIRGLSGGSFLQVKEDG